MMVRRARPDAVALAAILAVAAFVRFFRLDLMEFKADEANACRLALHVLGYSEPGIGRFFPTAGLTSSVGIPNPPLFVYLVAIPLRVVRSPLAAAAAIATVNLVAIWLTYVAGRRCFGRFAGLTAAALLALSPWGIVFSRKVWAQDLLPLCTTLFLLQLHALVVERRRSAALWLIVITGAAAQLHFSAFVLVVVLTLTLILQRRQLDTRWVFLGVGVVALLYAPYFAYHSATILHTARNHASYAGPSLLHRLKTAGEYEIGIVGGGSMKYLIGTGSALATVASALLGVAALLGLAVAARHARDARRQFTMLLIVWYLLPLVLLTALQIRPYMHYFIVLLPLPYLGIGYLAQLMHERRPTVAGAAVCLALLCFVLLDVRFFRTIIRDGGAPGDYGIAYRNKQEAVELILRDAGGRRVQLGDNPRFVPVKALTAFRFLIWNASPNAPARQGPAKRYLLLNSFAGRPALLRNRESYRQGTFGPLTVLMPPTVPLRARRSESSATGSP